MTNPTSATPKSSSAAATDGCISTLTTDRSFPKSRRLLRPPQFREVYNKGSRFTGPFFAAFCLRRDLAAAEPAAVAAGPHIGFTTPRALGKAVDRNRIRRRLREAVRQQLGQLGPQWDIVFNPRRPVLTATPEMLQREVEKLFRRCSAS